MRNGQPTTRTLSPLARAALARRRLGQRRRAGGNAILEMAMVLPTLMFLAMGMVEFGQFYYTKNAFTQAARDALRASIMHNAKQPDPYTAATTTLAAAGITFQSSWMTIVDITPSGWGGSYGTGAVSDVSAVQSGHAITVTIQTSYGALPNAVRPLYAMAGVGIPNNRAVSGVSTGLKE